MGNSFHPFSQTTTAVVGGAVSIVSGSAVGITQGSQAIAGATTEGSDKLSESERNSLLVFLHQLEKVFQAKQDIPSLNLFDRDRVLLGSGQSIAGFVAPVSTAPVSAIAHASQSVVDLSVSVSALIQSVQNPQHFTHAEAFTVASDNENRGLSAHCQALSGNLLKVVEKLGEQIDQAFGNGRYDGAAHASLAKTSATIPFIGSASVVSIISSALDAVGSVFRQLSVISRFSKLESASEGEKNIYVAFEECCQLSGKDSVASFAALRNLEAALSNFDIASKFGVESSAPVSSVLIRLLVSAPFLIALRSLIAISQSSKGLIYSIENPQELSHAEASTLDLQEVHNGFSAHVKFLKGHLANIAKKLSEEIDRGFGKEGLDPSNAYTAISTAAVPFMGAATSATVVSLGLDTIGSVLREISASIHFVQTESKNADDNEGVQNIYLALKQCGDVISGSGNNQQSLKALNELEAVLSNFKDGQQMSRNHSVSSPVVSVAARLLASAPVLTALRALIAVSQASKGLIGSIPDSRVFLHPASSIIELDKKDSFSANCSALKGHLKEVAAQLHHNIEMGFGDGDINRSNAFAAKSTAAVPFMGAATSAAVVSAGLDSIGSVLREISGLKIFCNNDLQSAEEGNIYFALSQCSAVISQSNSLESFIALKALEVALSDFQVVQNLGVKHSVSGPGISVATRLLTSSAFIEALKAVNSAGIAMTGVAHAFSNEKENFTQSSKASFTKASSIHALGSEGGNMHSQNVSELVKHFDILMQEIDKDLEIIKNQSERNVIADSAKGSARILSGLAMVPSLLTAAGGVLSRELSGVIDFSVNDKGTREESAKVRKTDKEQTGADLDKLLSRALEMKDRVIRAQELGLCTPIASGVTHVVTSGALIASLNSVAGICFALSALRNLSDPDQVPTKLKREEIEKAEKYKKGMVRSNQQSAEKFGTRSSSAHLSLHQKLQSVWEKVVLSDRSKLAIAPPGGIAVDRQDVNYTGQSLIAASQGNSTGFLSGALGILALTAMQTGISTESFCRLLIIGQRGFDRLADGPDQIQLSFFKSNFSSASNATRLSAEVMQESFLSQSSLRSTHTIGEVVLSRALSVAITHSKAISAMLGNLIAEERKGLQRDENYSDCALISARIMDKFADNILAQLNDAQKGHGMIDGLNNDMASQIASASKASIVTALSAHSIVIASFLQAHAVARKASVIQDVQTNEGLVDDDRGAVDSLLSKSVSRTVSQGLNIIRAFTINCIDALKGNALEMEVLKDKNSLIQMQENVNFNTAIAMISTLCISFVVEEMIEIGMSRSLGLLDQAQVKKSATQSSGISQGELKKVQEDVADDSALGNLGSMTYSISALRLLVSHLGESLAELGSQLKVKQQGLLQENLAMHTSQRDMMHHLSQSLTHCGAGLSQVAGVLSRLPILSEGVIDQLRMVVEGLNRQIRFEQSNLGSAENSRQSCPETVLTGVSFDVGTDGVVALVKSLVKASLLGLETTTAIAKFLEIVVLHQRPDEALILETRAGLSQPNGLLRNLDSKLIGASVGVSALMHSFSGETKSEESLDFSDMTEDSIRSLQGEIDSRIDRCQMLGDEEEQEEKDDLNKKIDLKQFYQYIAETLSGFDTNDADFKDLVVRFDRGGIDLASYHSDVGGLKGKAFAPKHNPLIQNGAFKGCNDASQLLDMFIAKAIDSQLEKIRVGEEGMVSLCDTLKIKLGNFTRSKKVEDTFTLIVDRIGDALFEKSKNPIRAPHSGRMFSRPPLGLTPKDIRAKFKMDMKASAPPPPAVKIIVQGNG